MAIKITPTRPDKFSTIDVCFGTGGDDGWSREDTQSVTFNVQSFDRSNVADPARSMWALNSYLNTLPLEQQRAVFDAYAAMRESFDNVRSRERLTKKLRLQVSALYDAIGIEPMFQWLIFTWISMQVK